MIRGRLHKTWASKGNNCAFVVLNHVVEAVKNFAWIRKNIGVKKNKKINFLLPEGRKLAMIYGCNVRVKNEFGKLIIFVDIDAELTADLTLKAGHYYLRDGSNFRQRKCEKCSENYYGEHVKCNLRAKTYMLNKFLSMQKSVLTRKMYATSLTKEDFCMEELIEDLQGKVESLERELALKNIIRKQYAKMRIQERKTGVEVLDWSSTLPASPTNKEFWKQFLKGKAKLTAELINTRKLNHGDRTSSDMDRMCQNKQHSDFPKYLNKVLIFDFECYFDKQKNNHVVYAVGFWYKGELVSIYGENSLQKFMVILGKITEKGTRLVSFNGSSYDNFLILHHLMKVGGNDTKLHIIRKGSKILYMKFGVFKTMDIYLFLGPSSLANCGKDFKIDATKGWFPHRYPRNMLDVFFKGKPLDANYYPKKMRNEILSEFGSFDTYNLRFLGKDPENPRKMYFDFEKECLEYLFDDIRVPLGLLLKFGESVFCSMGIDIMDFITLPTTAYAKWQTTIPKGIEIHIPQTQEHYKHIGIYGGRTEVIKRYFRSKQIGQEYDLVTDYLSDQDVCSLYPAAMLAEYSIGKAERVEEDEIARINLSIRDWCPTSDNLYIPVGDYLMDVFPRKDLIVSAIPQKDEDGNTVWDLKDRVDQPHNWIDMKTAVRHGYHLVVRSGYKYPENETASSDDKMVFKEYVELLFKLKQREDELKGTAEYNPSMRKTVKLLLNALYGKTIQKPIKEVSVFCSTSAEMDRFMAEYNWLDMEHFGKSSLMMVGEKLEFEFTISKPLQLGAAVLSYSRVLMNNLMDAVDPSRLCSHNTTLKQKLHLSFFYTDTDSEIIHVDHLSKLKKWQVCGTKKLGDLEDELETIIDGVHFPGKIIEARFVLKKTYALKYISKTELFPEGQIKFKFRAKGIPNVELDVILDQSYLRGKASRKEFLKTVEGISRQRKALLDQSEGQQRIFEMYGDLLKGKSREFTFDMIRKINSLHSCRIGSRPDLFSVSTEWDAKRTLRDACSPKREYIDETRLLSVPIGFITH